MNKSKMNDQIFDAMLQAAVEEKFQKEMQELPQSKDLGDEYELSQPAQLRIKKMIQKAYRRSILLRIEKISKRVAIILAIIIPTSLGSLLSVEASRNTIFNTLLNWKSDHVDIHYQDRNASSNIASSTSISSVIKPTYLPEGFFEIQTITVGSKSETEYRNNHGIKILLDQIPLAKEETIAVDTEHTTRKEIGIQGGKASLFVANTTKDKLYLVWKDHSHSFLLSSEISSDQLVKIAESIEK